MRILIGFIIVVVSIIIFGWWGLLSLLIALPFIGWKDRMRGPIPVKQRWSVCFSLNGEVKYELTHDRAGVLLGYVMFPFYEHKQPNDDWTIHLVFNKKNTAINLTSEFFPDNKMPAKELYITIGVLDPKFQEYGNPEVDPIFFSRIPYKTIPMNDPRSYSEIMDDFYNSEESNEIQTYYSILSVIFQ